MRFAAVQALEDVSLDFAPGQVHGVIGENGAGKSTLMKILAGVQLPTGGRVILDGKRVRFHNPAQAQAAGVVMIHQELNLIPDLSVAANIFLGRETTSRGLLKIADMRHRAAELLAEVGAQIDPDTLLKDLSIAQQQLVEIAKALSVNASVVIMDEPTAVLSRQEATLLFALIHRLRLRGITIIYISHILPEVLAISDQIIVLRDGRVVKQLDNSSRGQITESQLAALMVGRPLGDYYPRRSVVSPASPRLVVKNLTLDHLVHDVSFEIHPGEIVALAGLIGAGRTEVGQAIAGLLPMRSGSIQLDDRTLPAGNVRQRLADGIAYVSEDRKSLGLLLSMSVRENITLPSLDRHAHPLLSLASERAAAQKRITQLNVRPPKLEIPVGNLSGGNQQKVALARWLETNPRLLIVDEPTRGVDIGARQEIYRLLHVLTAGGLACLMISSELNEVLGMAHRILVMRQGRIAGELPADKATEQSIMALAAGVGQSREYATGS